ncbi:hypothetical protein Sme01_03520 [Sphaerisporangium melleum]|uniref:Uncharacterized protein n=1 Tax=Sphaerisporangium melleum TaxID=321316 RepID=A0A917VC69_9ACTN|nr:hypothetical protein [Sphaerisporangium melleum]GGK61688.1 hypothetical protein GCM10007964_01070 [Sphaerisporangium melleum]GII67876.1 hypothetical protein Sme01_03520 [Sphaerisporangium melleum]
MSVNYYAFTSETPEDEEGLHIGKHVAGKEFLFRAHRDLGLVRVEAWHEFLSKPGVVIRAEHGLEKAVEELMSDATKRPADAAAAGEGHLWPRRAVSFRAERGVPFADYEFF